MTFFIIYSPPFFKDSPIFGIVLYTNYMPTKKHPVPGLRHQA
ncbi:hypothetical protein A45J_1215 [hot springs metagenome]|uniref:Uncharacterized protein n=1 Tax=hot springs metagenome TaxID=433727 RepID=A0A5J4KW72_9ZZZZ